MYIAKKLREQNICEYLIYMWQIEDIIRAYKFDIDALKDNYLTKFNPTEQQMAELVEWYGNIIEMMRSEQVMESGHIQINKNVIINLTDLHDSLLKSDKFRFYSQAYYKALPYIVEIRNKGDRKDISEIENCFDALYGVMMLRLQKMPVNPDTEKAVKDITTMLGMLSDYYTQQKKGELEL